VSKKRVLIICTGNSARSQMAEALLRFEGGDAFDVYSAGTHPAANVRPEAVTVMQEINIDISAQHSKSISEFVEQRFDVTVQVIEAVFSSEGTAWARRRDWMAVPR
jgi:arsenate reductase